MTEGLPEGWIELKLVLAGSWGSGGTPSRKVPAYFGGGIPWIKSGDLNDGVILRVEETISRAGLENSSAKMLPAGTVSIAMYGATIGKTGILGMDAATNQACANCQVNERLVDKSFLVLYLRSQKDGFVGAGQGGAQPNISATILKDWPFPVAPIAEQRRIVEKVEALLEQVNQAKARLDRVPLILKKFRRSVLAAACSGELTREWRNAHAGSAEDFVKTIQSGRTEAIRSRRSSVLEPPIIRPVSEPHGWCETRIGDVAENLDSIRKPINRDERSGRAGGVPYYGANGQVGWIDTFLFDEDLVLVVEDETFIGRDKPFSYVVRGKSWVNNHAHVLRPLGGMSADYLNCCLSYYDFVPLTSGTTGRRKLTKAALTEAPLLVAPLAEQEEIVRCVQGLLSLAEAIGRRVEVAALRTEKLPQAILSKAFTGDLVPTEAELARTEGRSYESAEALLKRAAGEFAAGPPGKRIRRLRTARERT